MKRFLVGEWPQRPLTFTFGDDVKKTMTLTPVLTEMLKLVSHFSNKSEMDATIRVLSFVMDVVGDDSNSAQPLFVELQPSFPYFPTFTDFLTVTSGDDDGVPNSFIEVKKA